MTRALSLILPVAVFAGCTTVQYAVPAELHAGTDEIALAHRGYGEWSVEGPTWSHQAGAQVQTSFNLDGPGEREARAVCVRAPDPKGERSVVYDQVGYLTRCTVEEGGIEVAALSMTWADPSSQIVHVDALGERFDLGSSQRLEDAADRTPVAADWTGAIYGFDVERDGEAVAAIAYVGRPGITVQSDLTAQSRSALELAATVMLGVYRSNDADRQITQVASRL